MIDCTCNFNCRERHEDMIDHCSYTHISELLMLGVHCMTVIINNALTSILLVGQTVSLPIVHHEQGYFEIPVELHCSLMCMNLRFFVACQPVLLPRYFWNRCKSSLMDRHILFYYNKLISDCYGQLNSFNNQSRCFETFHVTDFFLKKELEEFLIKLPLFISTNNSIKYMFESWPSQLDQWGLQNIKRVQKTTGFHQGLGTWKINWW